MNTRGLEILLQRLRESSAVDLREAVTAVTEELIQTQKTLTQVGYHELDGSRHP